ncbi:MAG: hypothetical protein ACOYYU_07505 [Chloroflexota bacterium]
MNASLSTRNYDLFKLIVALILLALLLAFALTAKPAQPSAPTVTQAPPAAPGETSQATSIPPTVTALPAATETALPAPPAAMALPDFPASSQTLSLDAASEHLLTPDGSPVYALDVEAADWIPVIPEEVASTLPEEYDLTEPAPDQWEIHEKEDGGLLLAWDPDALTWQEPAESEPVAGEVDCPLALPPRLQVGKQAKVLTNLNMRSSPGIQNNWILTNVTGTKLEVVGGPVCTLYEGGAFLWWQVKNPAEVTGWSAEARQQGTSYYLEPLP